MSKQKNTWSPEKVIETEEALRERCLDGLTANSVLVFSIGSFVKADLAGFQSSIQMHPTFADELAELGYDVKVFNLGVDKTVEPIGEPVLQKAQVYYSSIYFDNKEYWSRVLPRNDENYVAATYDNAGFFIRLIDKVFSVGARIILIDNCSRVLLRLVNHLGYRHQGLIHRQLEIIHRYIGYHDGVAYLYHAPAFSQNCPQRENVMLPANSGDCYDGSGRSEQKRQYWIDYSDEHQQNLGDVATFYAEGLQQIKGAELLVLAPKMNPEIKPEPAFIEEEEEEPYQLRM